MKKISQLAVALVSITSVQAAITMTLSQVGSDVIGTYTGTVNTTDLTLLGNGASSAFMNPMARIMSLGPAPNITGPIYQGVASGPTFGSFSSTQGDLGTGDRFQISASNLRVPLGYVSGSTISGSTTWSGKTFATLGVNSGTYVWNWGAGANADSATLTVVPEPSSLILLTIATGLCCIVRKR